MPCPHCQATDHADLANVPYHLGIPRTCWLYANSPEHRDLWDGKRPPEPEPERPPGLFRQAASFAGAVARHIAGGLKTVEEDEYQRRLGICRGCEHFKAEANQCLACGCKIAGDLIAKARWQSERCPLNPPKW